MEEEGVGWEGGDGGEECGCHEGGRDGGDGRAERGGEERREEEEVIVDEVGERLVCELDCWVQTRGCGGERGETEEGGGVDFDGGGEGEGGGEVGQQREEDEVVWEVGEAAGGDEVSEMVG